MSESAVTPERSGEVPASDAGKPFVVQRHRARRLHYDLRLELGGVLVSWAVPKGPTLDADARRLAVHVEDHALDYFDYEGAFAGGGDVIVWDWGIWRQAGSHPERAIADGELHFDLVGTKLLGRFVLVRTDGYRLGGAKDNWLLLHKRDAHAVAGWDAEDHPRSVKSGLTNDEVSSLSQKTNAAHD